MRLLIQKIPAFTQTAGRLRDRLTVFFINSLRYEAVHALCLEGTLCMLSE